jgi:hypothetical protein
MRHFIILSRAELIARGQVSRTNAAQFVIGKAALGHQLHALGLLQHPSVPFDSDAVNMLTEMYHDHGDTIALQYGGSHLAHTMETYRKINQWTSHSRDMIEGIRRFYANSFGGQFVSVSLRFSPRKRTKTLVLFEDADKQNAIDLFLRLEMNPPLSGALLPAGPPRSYRDWYTPSHLETQIRPEEAEERMKATLQDETDYWLE